MTDTTTPAPAPALDDAALQELDDMLQALREREDGEDEIPQWEFCDGFLSAVACTRRPIPLTEWLPMLLGDGLPLHSEADGSLPLLPAFETPAQQARFIELAQARLAEIQRQLARPTRSLEEDDAFNPEVLDTYGAVLTLPEEERTALDGEAIPALAQVWALGFMFAVENWSDEWTAPRDKETAHMLNQAMELIVNLTEDDPYPPVYNLYNEDGPASTSQQRLDAFGEAIWAVYDLRQIWHSLGPQQETIYKTPQPGRNDPCSCGSGKKFKKCCGA